MGKGLGGGFIIYIKHIILFFLTTEVVSKIYYTTLICACDIRENNEILLQFGRILDIAMQVVNIMILSLKLGSKP